ncbi:cyclin-D2-1-like [Typha angustifolia]|uniref:cyclin-D2-1-like n=1 Tax=Typha angustifolia TaxID=59011 RepID=UPI003C2FBB61
MDLLCGEDAAALEEDSAGYVTEAELPDESDQPPIAELVAAEGEYSPGFDYPERFRARLLDPLARADSVAWILEVHSYFRFLPLTAYLAVNYMDRFLYSHCLPANEWALQLLSVACLSLAAKMEETLVPSLLDLQVEGSRFVFEPRTIRRMELLLLTALDWRLRSVTPFTFIDFFAYKVDSSGGHARALVSRATQFILAAIHDIGFLDHCPSIMAAAAILCAAEKTPTLASIAPGVAVSWCTGLTEEGITNCYQLMQRVAKVGGTQRKHPMILSELRVVTSTSNLGSGISSNSSRPPPSKRRKISSKCI